MKKYTLAACLALPMVFAFGSFARELPRMAQGDAPIHGGGAGFHKAGQDTINLMAATHDPTNNLDPRDGGLEPYYDGDFENADGDPAWNGWIHWDITEPTETHWNISTYNQPNPENHAAWCGNLSFVPCNDTDPAGGYGNNWHDLIEFRQAVPNPGTSSTVTVTATLIHDSEPAYDFTYLSYRFQGQPIADIQDWDGAGTEAVSGSVYYLPQEYLDGTDIAVYFRFKSDSAWSDADCDFPSAGGCQVDDINVRIVNGLFTGNYFEDFEHGGDPENFGIWNVAFPDGVGDFAQIWTGLEDADPCFSNYTPQVAFIDDGVVVPGTGGSECVSWCYGPDGYIVTTTGGLAGPSDYIHNAIESPVMAWPHPKGGGAGPDYDGIRLTFGVYRHEDLSDDAPGIYYTWAVRSADTDGSAGDVQNITLQPWRNRGRVDWHGPQYIRAGDDVTDLMNSGRDQVQVQLAVLELGYAWGYIGNDGYPAPYFDNVTVKVFPYIGPAMSASALRLAQDNFPDRGSIDTGDLGSHSVRFDMADHIGSPERIDPGDSVVVDIVPVRAGADFHGDPELNYILEANPVFDPYRTSGLPDQGSVIGMPAIGSSGNPGPNKWAFDLPDTGFLYPGDVLHYYISATDAIGGADPQTSLMPADTTGFSTGFGDPMGYNSLFTVRALPGIRSDGFGGFEQPEILYIRFTDHGGEQEWFSALNNIGLRVDDDYDVYYINSNNCLYGNGIGGRASSIMLTDYDDILFSSEQEQAFTILHFGIETLTNWLGQGGKDIFLTGDGLANDLSYEGTVYMTFLEEVMGATMVTSDVRGLIDNQATPLIKAVPGNPVFTGELQTWIAYGGCPRMNTFDGVNTYGTGQRLAEFTDASGQMGQFNFSAATLNIMNPGPTQSRAISMPMDLMFVHTDPAAPGNPLAGRAQLLEDVLMYFGQVGDPIHVTPVLPKFAFATSNYPNPFNPGTTIKYSLPKAGHLKLSIYNVRGHLVKTLIDGTRPAGEDQTIAWDGTNNQGAAVSAGVYFYEARAGGEVKVRKMALVK